MTDRTRRIVAYVAGRMILKKDAETILDVETAFTTQFDGVVDLEGGELTDLEEQSTVQVRLDGRAYLLEDRLKSVPLRFFIRENRFFGWDLSSDTPFFGHASENAIVIGEPDSDKRYQYLL